MVLGEVNKNGKSEKLSISLSFSLKNEVDNIANELNSSRSKIISDALEYYFDYLDLALAEKRFNANEKRFSFDEAERILNDEENLEDGI